MTEFMLHGYSGGYLIPIGATSGLPGRIQADILGSVAITTGSIEVNITVGDFISVTPSGTFYTTSSGAGIFSVSGTANVLGSVSITSSVVLPISGNIGITFTSSTTGSQGLILVGSPATLIRGPVTARKDMLITNVGSNIIYLGFAAGVAQTSGIPLYPASSFHDDVWIGSWFGVSTGNTSAEIRYLEMS